MDAEEWLARITAHGPRLDAARGGSPELTAPEAAGTLGLVRAGLGRDLLEYMGTHTAPRAPEPSPRWLDDALIVMMARRRYELAVRLASTKAALDAAEAIAGRNRRHTDDERWRIQRLRSDHERAKVARWPEPGKRDTALRALIWWELWRTHCMGCHGRGKVMQAERLVNCAECDGRGRWKVTDAERAKWMGIRHNSFAQTWRGPHHVLHGALANALAMAAEQLSAKVENVG